MGLHGLLQGYLYLFCYAGFCHIKLVSEITLLPLCLFALLIFQAYETTLLSI
jgi:hypothetical protein